MKKTTPQNLSKRLAQYGALSIAIAGVADASGQIIHTDIDPDEGGDGVVYLLDLDNDMTDDFQIWQQFSSNLRIEPLLGGAVLGSHGYYSNYNYPFALNSGYTISAAASSWILGYGNGHGMVYSNCYYTGSDRNKWCDVEDKYLGLRFLIGADTHYGWARLTVNTLPDNWVIKDYAYNSMRDLPIMAGEGIPLGIDDNVFSGIKIVSLNKNIALFNLPQRTNYRLFSLTGQSVLDGKIANSTHVIVANTLATGVYIIELKDNDSNAVIRKKIVL